ncbi:21065_t:CDS:2, partial [Cetraspora pellucida]
MDTNNNSTEQFDLEKYYSRNIGTIKDKEPEVFLKLAADLYFRQFIFRLYYKNDIDIVKEVYWYLTFSDAHNIGGLCNLGWLYLYEEEYNIEILTEQDKESIYCNKLISSHTW